MVVVFSCDCLNVSVHLRQQPHQGSRDAEIGFPEDLSDDWKEYRTGDLAMGGIQTQQDFLVGRRNYDGWKLVRCLNCEMDVCALPPVAKYAVISRHLQEMKNRDRMALPEAAVESGKRYSPAYRVILSVNPPSSTTSQTSTSSSCGDDTRSDAALRHLQTQLQDFLQKENQLMDMRIRKQQLQQYQILQQQCEQDFQLLWRTICRVGTGFSDSSGFGIMSEDLQHPDGEAVPEMTPTQESSPFSSQKEDCDVDNDRHEREGHSNLKSSQPPVAANSPAALQVAGDGDVQSSSSVFTLDEDLDRSIIQELTDTSDTIEEREQENDTEVMPEVEVHAPTLEKEYRNSALLGSSLPMRIPSLVSRHRIPESLAQVGKSEKMTDNPIDHNNHGYEQEVARSFVVPLSMNRRLKNLSSQAK